MKKKISDDFATDHLTGITRTTADTIVGILTRMLVGAPFGGGCRAFYAPWEWCRKESMDLPDDVVLVLCHDGGDLAPLCNAEYDYPRRPEWLEAMKAAGYTVRAGSRGWSMVSPVVMRDADWMRALENLVGAARGVDNLWPEGGASGYPKCLPSWSEFTDELESWLAAERAARKGGVS